MRHGPRQSTLLEMIQCAGMVFQRPETQITGTRFSVREEVACGPENLGLHRNAIIERVEDALERTKLTHLADRNPLTLSGGEKQRLALASILALRPSLLVLDEATSQLDPVGEQDVMDIVSELARQGTAVIIAATTPEGFSEQADKVAIMQDGELTMLDDTRNAFASNLLPDNGIARPICMELALKARAEGLWPEDLPLPLSMGEAAETLATIVREAGHAP
ncbi:energy-coupling factor ABC transporter ATP-binding protein [Salidesulfovibrio brasiliensis]|uniref:energy-coupling factor ABC transporter ATP-binding protein n=1 Tax=Salidesulfovibrio brasiliensis TaxID=221711 RepID=UPI0009F97AD9|nr:ATP-binding cassette domain-containing protein [Salidesulfovibrio brasiliensis]